MGIHQKCPAKVLLMSTHDISRAERKTVVSQMVVFPKSKSLHYEGIMKITTFLSVWAMAPTLVLYIKGSKLPLNKGFKNMFKLYYSLAINPRYAFMETQEKLSQIIKYCSLRSSLWIHHGDLGRVFQSLVSLTSSLVVKMLTVLVSTISNSQVFLLKKCE